MENQEDNQTYCMNMTRRDDPDRYLTVLFAPAEKRRSLFALYAFNQEVAKTRESVSEAMIGEIRLQWWVEAIEQILNGHVREHPVVQELSNIEQIDKLAPTLIDIITARKSDLYTDGIADVDALNNYARSVGGKLCDVAVQICNGVEAAGDPAAITCGASWAMMGLLRAIPYYDNSEEQILSFGIDHSQADISAQMMPIITEIAQTLEHDVQNIGRVKGLKDASPLLLLAIVKRYLRALKKANYHVFEMNRYEPGGSGKIISMLRQALLGIK